MNSGGHFHSPISISSNYSREEAHGNFQCRVFEPWVKAYCAAEYLQQESKYATKKHRNLICAGE